MRCMFLGFALALFGLAAAAAPPAYQLSGSHAQGGLIIGEVPPGTQVTQDGKTLRVSEGGTFVFGFSHDAAPQSSLAFVWPDGGTHQQTLTVEQRQYREQHINGLPPKKVTPPPEVTARLNRERAMVREARAISSDHNHWTGGFIWPADGRVTGVYGSRRVLNGLPRWPHFGLDVAGPPGTEVRAPAGGTVLLAERDFYYEGGIVIIDHGFGVSSTLFHLLSVDVEVGQAVGQGDTIGAMGATGRATGSHVDWRINWHDVRLDPAFLVPPMVAQD